MKQTYKIIEQYDGANWRVLASADTPEAAEKQMEREVRARHRRGYSFFRTERRMGPAGQGPYSNSEITDWPEWDRYALSDYDLECAAADRHLDDVLGRY